MKATLEEKKTTLTAVNTAAGETIKNLACIQASNTKSGHVEIQIASASSNYQVFETQPKTTFKNETNGTWQLLSNGDLGFIKTSNTPNGHVEVHIASASSNYQNRTVQTPTVFGNETNGIWQFLKNNDLAFIKTSNTPNGHVEVHIASASSNYQNATVQTPTTFKNQTNGTWQLLNNNDLAFIKTSSTPNGHVEVHIASASSNYQKRTVQTPTTFKNETNGTWQLLSNNDLAFIKTISTPNGHVEVHIASASSNYQKRTIQTPTVLLPENNAAQTWALGSFSLDTTILPVALIPQKTNMWCWAASAEMIMKYLGKDVSQCEQANYRFNQTDCCILPTPSKCIQGGWPNFSHWGFNSNTTTWGTALSFAQLEAQFVGNDPIGFSWGWTGGGGHMMVARGIKKSAQMVYINDPWSPNVGDTRWISYSDYVSGSNHVHWRDYYDISKVSKGQIVSKTLNTHPMNDITGFENATEAANSGLQLFSSLVNDTNFKEMGFPETIDPNKTLEISVPLKSYFVRHDALKTYQENENAKDLLIDQNEFIYPVYYDRKLVSSVVVNLKEGQWVVKSVGDSNFIKDVINARESHSKSSTISESAYAVVKIPSLYYIFLGHEQDATIMFTHIHDNKNKNFAKSKTQHAKDVFAAIKPDALTNNFALNKDLDD